MARIRRRRVSEDGLIRPMLALLVAAFSASRLLGSQQVAREYEVKAAFLFRFAQFVHWPKEAKSLPGETITIGILGEDPFGPVLESLVADKQVGGRSFSIRRFRTTEELEPCHIVFVSAQPPFDVASIRDALRGAPVLLVGETEEFAESGGIIELYLDSRRVRFEINLRAAERAGLRMDSTILSLARLVTSQAGSDP